MSMLQKTRKGFFSLYKNVQEGFCLAGILSNTDCRYSLVQVT